MELAARIGTMARRGAPLPYDAEVEYLESTGTQCIDTGIIPVLWMKFDLEITRLGSGNTVFFGCRGAGTAGDNYQCYANWNGKFSNYKLFLWTGRAEPKAGEYSNYDLGLNVMTRIVGAEVVPPFSGTNGYAIQLFGFNIIGVKNTESGICKFGSFRAYDDEKEYINLKPVRIGVEGAMYDRVSGQLLRNAGTGEFIVGPDKTT